jgi:tetratricopeptide (TPR) repeat protein
MSPGDAGMWESLGHVYRQTKDDEKALAAFNKALELASATGQEAEAQGGMPINATLDAISILTRQARYPEALVLMERYKDEDIRKMPAHTARRMFRAFAQVYLAMGNEEEARAKFKAALEFDNESVERILSP